MCILLRLVKYCWNYRAMESPDARNEPTGGWKMGAPRSQEYFADGVTDALITNSPVEIDPRDLADISYSVQECEQVTAANRARIECRRGRGRDGGWFLTER